MNNGERAELNQPTQVRGDTERASENECSRLSRRGLLAAVTGAGGGAILPVGGVSGSRPRRKGEADNRPVRTPPIEAIPDGGLAENFELVGHLPLMDDYQYAGNAPLGIPRGSNGDITIAGDYVYVGSFVGYQPPVIVDVSKPRDPTVVGPVPDAVPGVGNGIEGIEASGNLLVVDQRAAMGGLGFDVPEGMPSRGLAIYDISDPREPTLVARHGYGGLDTHTVSLWRDPTNSDRILAVQSFTDVPDIKVLDLSDCLDGGDPKEVANWDLGRQTDVGANTHEAIISTDGRRIYVSQLRGGVFLLDSSNLVSFLRNGDDCDASTPESAPGEQHCLTLLNPDIDARADTAPPFDREWHHTPIKIPNRPYLLALAESSGPSWDRENGSPVEAACPGALTRVLYIGEGDSGRTDSLRGDRNPETVGVFGLPEQRMENCGKDGWKSGTVAFPAWFSPHNAVVFPNVAFATYYGAGLRAIDISNPSIPVEAGYFFNEPVAEVRWASYGIQGETEEREDGRAVRRPAPGPNHMFAFSYPVVHDGYLVYVDVHSGLYVLDYDGPHADEIPEKGNCLSGNPGAVEPGFEPCPPYGRTDWSRRTDTPEI